MTQTGTPAGSSATSSTASQMTTDSSLESRDVMSTSAMTTHGPSVSPDPAGYHHGVVPEALFDGPAAQPVKFYQVGSFAVGNRLLPDGRPFRAVRPQPHELPDLRTPRLSGLR
ncbi:MAG: hypothetical protein V9G15_09865 [Dermatophilaceae bacterium]